MSDSLPAKKKGRLEKTGAGNLAHSSELGFTISESQDAGKI